MRERYEPMWSGRAMGALVSFCGSPGKNSCCGRLTWAACKLLDFPEQIEVEADREAGRVWIRSARTVTAGVLKLSVQGNKDSSGRSFSTTGFFRWLGTELHGRYPVVLDGDELTFDYT